MERTEWMEKVLQALEAEAFPKSSRRNVRDVGDERPIEAMCLGTTTMWSAGPVVSRATKDRPHLAKLLCSFARAEFPGLTFSSIQVNKDYRATLHVDGNNCGPSHIIGLGDYVGGELWADDGSPLGHAVSIRQEWFTFDGTKPHCVMPFRGRRYTLVYFTYYHPLGNNVSQAGQETLVGLGFPLPSDVHSPITRQAFEKEELLVSARVRLHRFCSKAATVGGVDRIKLRVRCVDGTMFRVAVSRETTMEILGAAIGRRWACSQEESASARLEDSTWALFVNGMTTYSADTVDALGLTPQDILEARLKKDCVAYYAGGDDQPREVAHVNKSSGVMLEPFNGMKRKLSIP